MACGVGLLGVGLGLYARHATALPPAALRPPGALPENGVSRPPASAAACACATAPTTCCTWPSRKSRCPPGTPYFVARQAPCEMCEDIPCVKACPTGALDHSLTDIDKARMGLAVLVDHETCLNFLGLRCDICYRVCPVIDKAITLDPQTNARTGNHTLFIPVVHSEHCTGCGKCEKACPTEIAAIKVFPLYMAKGQLSAHYRLGWVEKEKAGGSLVAPDVEHQYNLPEGMKYEYGKGLSVVPPGTEPGQAPSRQRRLPRPCREASYEHARHTSIGAEAIAEKGWLAAHKWLMLRRASQLGILLAFLVGPWFGAVDRQGQPQLQLHAGRAAADRSLSAAADAGERATAGEAAGLIGVAIVIAVLPAGRRARLLLLGLPGESGDRFRQLAAHAARAEGRRAPVAQHALLDPRHDAGRCGADRHHRLGNGQSGVDAASRPDLRDRVRLDGDPGACSCSTCS